MKMMSTCSTVACAVWSGAAASMTTCRSAWLSGDIACLLRTATMSGRVQAELVSMCWLPWFPACRHSGGRSHGGTRVTSSRYKLVGVSLCPRMVSVSVVSNPRPAARSFAIYLCSRCGLPTTESSLPITAPQMDSLKSVCKSRRASEKCSPADVPSHSLHLATAQEGRQHGRLTCTPRTHPPVLMAHALGIQP